MSAARARRGQAGFTLLEVLVAFAILSLTVVVAVQAFAQGLRLLKLSGDHQQAALLADQKTREVTQPKEGKDSGTEGAFTWERTIKEIPAPELTPNGQLPKWHVYEITTLVSWGDSKRTVGVTTLRTVSDAEQKAQQQGLRQRP
ncbi:MAG TPA: prepilin-type N-terminal cleavage/methylation domain-containing protein [Candidatus Binatia bacterium]|nr:prepilin-type N-terminal cleavage/methylation domain-containing protein [Candidatus Binatia bacterium]